MTITAAIIAKTDDINPFTLKSLSFADEIIVILDGNQDKKPFVRGKIKYFFHPLNGDFSAQRNYAISKTNSAWIVFIDSDEYVSSELALEIKQSLFSNRNRGYLIPRKDVVYHNVLKYGETGDVKILRLAQKDAGKFSRAVHEVWKITGNIVQLHSPIYHFKDHFVSEFSSRISQYAPVDATELEIENKPFTYFKLVFFPIAKFVQNYILRLGFLDGTPGLFLAYLLGVQSLSVRIFQWTKVN